jgi:hypothetical protein
MAAAIAFLLVLVAASSAAAQSAYVGGSVLADVVRLSGTSDAFNPGSGEAIGGALRVGASLGSHWGVDLEFSRSADIDGRPEVNILTGFTFNSTIPGSVVGGIPTIFPPPDIRTRQQLSTLATMLWWRHEVSGGVAFNRTAREFRFAFPAVTIPVFPTGGVVRPSQVFEQETVSYDAGVAVGLDAGIAMTDHLRLVPGVRLLTVPDGWVLRPAVGLQWLF